MFGWGDAEDKNVRWGDAENVRIGVNSCIFALYSLSLWAVFTTRSHVQK